MKHDSYYARLKSILAKPKNGATILVSRRVLEGLADEMEAAAREINRLVPPPLPDVWIARQTRPEVGSVYQLQFGQAMYRTKGAALAAGPFAARLEGIDPEPCGWSAPMSEYHPRYGQIGTRLAGQVAEVAELEVRTRHGGHVEVDGTVDPPEIVSVQGVDPEHTEELRRRAAEMFGL